MVNTLADFEVPTMLSAKKAKKKGGHDGGAGCHDIARIDHGNEIVLVSIEQRSMRREMRHVKLVQNCFFCS